MANNVLFDTYNFDGESDCQMVNIDAIATVAIESVYWSGGRNKNVVTLRMVNGNAVHTMFDSVQAVYAFLCDKLGARP